MTISRQWKETIFLALFVGALLAAYVSVSMFYETDLSIWLWINNALIITSLLIVFALGYRLRGGGSPMWSITAKVGVFYAVVMGFYVGSYALTTSLFADRLAWMPFFHRDYSYHGFRSVREYLDHKDNFVDLLVLQIFSCLIGSVMYFAAGTLGALARRIVPPATN